MNTKQTLGGWIIEQIIKEQTEIKTIVAIYPGRFQPMGAHHAAAFKSIPFKEKFIATSNKVAPPKSPFNFAEKKKIISAYGLGGKLKQVKNPYKAEEILKRYDPETTAAVFVVGAKDASRLGGKFFRPWKGKAEVGYRDGAYTFIAPHVSMNVPGYGAMSGTSLRAALGDKALNKKEKQKIYKGVFGHLKNYDWIIKKLEKLNELNEANLQEKSTKQYNSGRIFVMKSPHAPKHMPYDHIGFITDDGELIDMSGHRYTEDGKEPMPPQKYPYRDTEDLFKMPKTKEEAIEKGVYKEIPLPKGVKIPSTIACNIKTKNKAENCGSFVKIVLANNGIETTKSNDMTDIALAVANKSADGKKSFKNPRKKQNPSATKIKKKSGDWWNRAGDARKKSYIKKYGGPPNESIIKLFSKNWWTKTLNEGGAYGHMSHPFDDKGLTFGDFKQIISNALQGHLDLETSATEKTDGQNLFITWNKGLKAARNTGDIKRGGISASGVKLKFANRGNIEKAFNYAMKDLAKAISGLSDKQKKMIFDDGNNWVNMEIMYPASANVIVYDAPYLQFHNVLQYKHGSAIGTVTGGARTLAGMIAQINQNLQKSFSIIGPRSLKVKPHQDFGAKRPYFIGKLSRLMSQFGMKDSNSFGEYHQAWWEDFVDKKIGAVDNKIKTGLVKRWAFFDKSFRLNKKFIEDEKVLEKAKEFDKINHAGQVKKNMFPFETLFFELGAEVLKNAEGFLAASPDRAVQSIRNQLAKAISDVRKGGDLKKLNRLKTQLSKIEAIGGFKTIVPSEGLVFVYKGNTYKLTGAFAPVNQITGLMSF